MFKLIESPVINHNLPSSNQSSHAGRNKYQRYSSVDQLYDGKNQWNQNSSRLVQMSDNKINSQGEKTSRLEKQRAHSQKKLTLTSSNPTNSINTINAPYTLITNNHNSSVMNARQAFEGFKKNLQLNSNNYNKTTLLEKKGKFSSMKSSQSIKFPSSSSNIRFDSNTLIDQKQNENQIIQKFSLQAQKERSRALLQTNKINLNRIQKSNPQNFYKQPQPFYTAPTSPVYSQNHISYNADRNNNDSSYGVRNSTPKLQNPENKLFIEIFSQKFNMLKEQTNKIILQNSMKIKQLQSLLLQNKQQINVKNQKIRQLQMQILLKQQRSARKIEFKSQTSINLNTKKSSLQNQNNDYLLCRLSDVQKKLEVLTKWSSDEQLNKKIDTLNTFLSSFMQVKFHNLKFTLKTFMNKNQQKITQIIDKINRVDNIIKIDHIQSYQKLLQKSLSIHKCLENLAINMKTPVSFQKHQTRSNIDQMKNTMNTFNSSLRNKTTQESFHNMQESRDINDSFWQNMEDFSIHQSAKLEEPSFTDDSFSYAPGAVNDKINSNSNSSCHQFALGSFPSFSKFSIDVNTNARASNMSSLNNRYLCKQSIQLSQNYFQKNINSSMNLSSSIQTLEQIAKYRKGPVNAYIDSNGYIRYKGSQSCIFDKKGNILKPSKAQIQYCLTKNLITLQSP